MVSPTFINENQLNYFNLQQKTVHVKGAVVSKSPTFDKKYAEKRIWINDIEVIPEIGFSLRPYYGCNFEWGWEAPKSAFNTSLSVCCVIFKDERIAENLFVPFKEEFIDLMPDHDFEMNIDLTEFLLLHQERLHPHLYSRFCFSALINSREILMFKDPQTGKISANLAENYAMHDRSMSNLEVKKLNERKQRLTFRIFAKEDYLITGYTFEKVMEKSEEVMERFYSKSFDRFLKGKC